MKNVGMALLIFALPSLAIGLIVTAIYIKIGVWSECRVDHSFMYCWSLVSK